MTQSLSNILVHAIFSTNDREPMITQSFKPKLHRYMASILHKYGCMVHAINGTHNHVHILFKIPVDQVLSTLIGKVKSGSTNWAKKQLPDFRWQCGYGAFSVSRSQQTIIMQYIENQEQHHKTITFENEFVAILNKSSLKYDARYLWN